LSADSSVDFVVKRLRENVPDNRDGHNKQHIVNIDKFHVEHCFVSRYGFAGLEPGNLKSSRVHRELEQGVEQG
jgi:hypothetical protein